MKRQLSLFEDQRLDLQASIDLSLMSLNEYGQRYRHWCVAYSGGKDSSATVTFVAWAIKSGLAPTPESLTILYADTRMELPPLQKTAVKFLTELRQEGFNAKVVMPPLDDRFFVYMFGRRTGCVGCPLASRDFALERLIKKPEWSLLKPLLELKPLYRELKKPQYRLRKSEPEIRKDGQISKNVQRMGPLTFEARAYGLERVLDIQARAAVDLINPEEEVRIRELWTLNTWPNGWSGDEVTGDVALDALQLTDSGDIAIQALLVR